MIAEVFRFLVAAGVLAGVMTLIDRSTMASWKTTRRDR